MLNPRDLILEGIEQLCQADLTWNRTTELSKLLTLGLTAVKKHVIKYCEKVY